MNKPAQTRVTKAGMVFSAAPTIKTRILGPQPIPGSKPRNWESRKSGECAAIVKSVHKKGEWPVHYACCQPAVPDTSYCVGHPIRYAPETSTKELIRGLRKYTEK